MKLLNYTIEIQEPTRTHVRANIYSKVKLLEITSRNKCYKPTKTVKTIRLFPQLLVKEPKNNIYKAHINRYGNKVEHIFIKIKNE